METWREYKVMQLQKEGILLVEDGNHGESRPRTEEFGKGDVAFIRATDMDAGRVLFESAARINTIARERIRKGIGSGGDVLLSHKGTVGKLAFVPMNAPQFVCSPQTTFWRSLDQERLDRRYLYYYLCSEEFTQQLASRKGETDMADYVSLTAQRDLTVLIPPIMTQRAIAGILGTLDDKIVLNRKMNRTLESMARAIFRSWFVDFEPVSAKRDNRNPVGMDDAIAALFPSHFRETAMGPIPTGWEPGNTADIARYMNGKNFTKNATGTGRMVVRIAELNSGLSGSTIYNEIEADPQNTAFPGDLLFSWSGSLDVYRWHRNEALVNQHIFKVLCDEYPQWFVHFHLQEAMPFFQGVAADKATTMGHIKREHLSQPDVALPPAELIAAANRIIQPMYDRMHRSERQILSLVAQRDTLLSQLLSGELQVGQTEKIIGEA